MHAESSHNIVRTLCCMSGGASVWDIVSQSCMHGGILSHQDPARADPLSGIRPGSWPALGLLSPVRVRYLYGDRRLGSVR
jgi:hypothetical protein